MDINDMIKQIRHKYAKKERDLLLKCYQVVTSVKKQAKEHISDLTGQPKEIAKYKKHTLDKINEMELRKMHNIRVIKQQYKEAVMDALASVSK